MTKELEGYVVYQKDHNQNTPYGVVSENYECQANCGYIPSRLKDYLIQFEDIRFFHHNGIDYRGIARAAIENIKALKIIQGGSTITQQLARNILRDNRKSIFRKIRETIEAFKLENNLTKDEILNLYFNQIYFGKNLRGIRAAGLHYFGKEVNNLSPVELLYLLTILRGPNYYLNNQEKTIKRFELLSHTLYNRKIISQSRHLKNIKTNITFKQNQLHSIKSKAAGFIIEKIDIKSKIIFSTIDSGTQIFCRQFVEDSKYPISIIALNKVRVIGFASSYGTDYPFGLKTNVGSTLKPFLYCYLREKGISLDEKFNSFKNDIGWSVREVSYHKSLFTIDEALFNSNNNAFINASQKIGIDNTLDFLASILTRDKDEFYPSSILGATRNGISLFELAYTYSIFFDSDNLTSIKRDCLSILNKIAKKKLKIRVNNIFLKTGTTNDNKESLAIIQSANETYAILRNENPSYDNSKDGNLMKYIRQKFRRIIDNIEEPNKEFKW